MSTVKKFWEPQLPGAVRTCLGMYMVSFTFTEIIAKLATKAEDEPTNATTPRR
jgi:hypothetical protein